MTVPALNCPTNWICALLNTPGPEELPIGLDLRLQTPSLESLLTTVHPVVAAAGVLQPPGSTQLGGNSANALGCHAANANARTATSLIMFRVNLKEKAAPDRVPLQ